jgi:hypothetical protein
MKFNSVNSLHLQKKAYLIKLIIAVGKYKDISTSKIIAISCFIASSVVTILISLEFLLRKSSK